MKSVGKVRFIGHAGIAIQTKNAELLIDPWLDSSTLENPVLRGFFPPHQEIAFLHPKSKYKINDFAPQTILLSNFKSCHAPHNEIIAWIEARKICLGLPEPDLSQGRLLLAALTTQQVAHIDFHFCLAGQTFQQGPFTIHAHFHPSPNHLIWEVSCPEFNVLYIPQTPYTRGQNHQVMDICFEKFTAYKPDFLFLECAGQTSKGFHLEKAVLDDRAALTPLQAARLAAHIQPRITAVIGQFSESHPPLNENFYLPAHVIEEQFKWALQHLAPQIKTLNLRSGQEFLINKLAQDVKTAIHLLID